MRARKFFNIVLLACCFLSCQEIKHHSDVRLTDFTKELISLYINDSLNIDPNSRRDDIIIISVEDTSYYYLFVFGNNSKEYKFCREDFIGKTMHLEHLVRIFGSESSMFYSINEKIKKQERCKDNYREYDPNVWQISFYKDKSFCKMRTYKGSPREDISEIELLVEKHFIVSQDIRNEIYQSYEIENEAKFVLGEDVLRQLISSNFKIRKEDNFDKLPLVVNIVVDEKGKATLKGIVKSSNDTDLDNEAIRVAKIICQYDFIPASHRGETVKAIYPIIFLRSDITP